jgi:uncharacterized membrane protein YidH (DUF202 family)
MRYLGIILIILGGLMMIYTGFNYVTKEKVVDLGTIEVNKEKNHPVQWSPIVGAIMLVGGISVIAANKGKKIGDV